MKIYGYYNINNNNGLIIEIPDKNLNELKRDDIKKINEINNDILLLINDQHENIISIENDTNKTMELSEKANNDLEITSGYSFKFAPIAIGGGIGALLTLPFTTSASMGVIGYSLLGGSIAGGVLGKHFS